MIDDDDIGAHDTPTVHQVLIEQLMRHSVRWLLQDPDPQRFIEHLAQHGAKTFGGLFEAVPGQSAAEAALRKAQFMRSFAWSIASMVPLPQQGYAPRRLPLPGRNQPCICGSGRKFKHCCARLFEAVPSFESDALGALMVMEMGRERWAELPGTPVPPRLVETAAFSLREEGNDRDARTLLEPWAKLPAPWPAAHAGLLDLLCDIYLDQHHPRKRKLLAEAMVANGDVPVQSMGWRRLSMMAADKGDADAADVAFAKAQRLTPDEPDVAVLEVTLLLGAGHRVRAAERASFHARRLARLPHAAALADEIEMLEKLGRGEFPALSEFDDDEDDGEDDDEGAGASSGIDALLDANSPLQALQRWAQGLPPPKLRLQSVGADATDMGALIPAAALVAPLVRWRKAFALELPTSVWGQLGPEALDVFVDERWSALLQRDPRLADCFEVLDGLLLLLDLVPMGLAVKLQVLLLERALNLWAQLLERSPAARCEWAELANRPALRLLARRIDLDTTPRADESLRWLKAMVEVLNPHDNHGLRERLAAVCLRRQQAAAALALCERYPGDFVGMQLLHVLALLALQRVPDAAARLQAALKTNPHVAPLLTASRKPREPNVFSYAVGSPEEAKIAVAKQHDLWRAAPVQKWLKAQLQPGAAPGLFDDAGPLKSS